MAQTTECWSSKPQALSSIPNSREAERKRDGGRKEEKERKTKPTM
jgi:hypothetical protein